MGLRERLFGVVCVASSLAVAGCSGCCEMVECVGAEEQEPIAAGPLGPRGLPRWEPLDVAVPRYLAVQPPCASAEARQERANPAYERLVARPLRGNVAMLELRVASAQAEAWTLERSRSADRAAAAARRFLLDEAKRYGIGDLSLTIYRWDVTTALPPVSVASDELARPNPDAALGLRREVFAAIAEATGVTVAEAVASLRARGHESVVVVVRLPTTTFPREWADLSSLVPVTFGKMQGVEAGTVAHEILHLFGADDLYRLKTHDPDDALDVMGGLCGPGQVRIGDQTAWAVGWRDMPPARRYETRTETGQRVRAAAPPSAARRAP